MSALTPDLARATQMMRSGRLKDAARIVEAALERDPDDIGALHLLGSIATMRGDRDAAAAWFERGLAVAPDAIPLLCGLANLRRALGRFDDALALYDRALATDATCRPALVGKAGVLERAGRHAEARDLLTPLIESGDEGPEAAFLHATLLRHAGADADAAALVAKHLAKRDLAPIVRRKLLYLNGACRERLGETEAAFNAYRSANALLVRPFDVGPTLARFERLAERLTRARLAALPASTRQDERPVFIVGMPRCGSTLVEQILDAHPDVRGTGEVQFLGTAIAPLLEALGVDDEEQGPGGFDQDAVDRAATTYLDALDGAAPGARRIVDKNLANFRFVGLIDRLFPAARIIHCRRDPTTTCFSIWSLPLSPAAHPYKTDLRTLGRYYRAYERLMACWRDAVSLPLLDVDYEALVADPEAGARAITGFCDLPWNDACLRFHESDRAVGTLSYEQVRQPVYGTSVDRAAPFGPWLGPLRDALVAPG